MMASVFFAVQLSESWLVSAAARRVYVASAALSVFLAGMICTRQLGAFAAGGTLVESPALATALWALIFPGVLGTAVLWVAMWYFCLRCHQNNGVGRGIWMIVLWLLGPIGAFVYFLAVYLRSPLVRSRAKQLAATA